MSEYLAIVIKMVVVFLSLILLTFCIGSAYAKTIKIGVEGMVCDFCAQSIQKVFLKQAGVVGFTNANKPIYNPLLMKRILSYSTMLDLPVIQHADIPELSMDTEATESENSTRLGLRLSLIHI